MEKKNSLIKKVVLILLLTNALIACKNRHVDNVFLELDMTVYNLYFVGSLQDSIIISFNGTTVDTVENNNYFKDNRPYMFYPNPLFQLRGNNRLSINLINSKDEITFELKPDSNNIAICLFTSFDGVDTIRSDVSNGNDDLPSPADIYQIRPTNKLSEYEVYYYNKQLTSTQVKFLARFAVDVAN